MNNFQLDGETIIALLNQRKTNGIIEAEVSPQAMFEIVRIREPGVVEMTFQRGEIVACSLTSKSGRVVISERAALLKILPQAGVLQWQLELSTTSIQATPAPFPALRPALPNTAPTQRVSSAEIPAVFSRSAPYQAKSIPYRLGEIQLHQIQDPTVRKIYQLIDGQRSVDKISVLSRLPQPTVSLALQQLHAWGIVAFY